MIKTFHLPFSRWFQRLLANWLVSIFNHQMDFYLKLLKWRGAVTFSSFWSSRISKLCPFPGCPEKNSGNSDSGKAAPTTEGSAKWTTSVKTEVKAQETAHHRGRCQTKDRLLNQQTGADPPIQNHMHKFLPSQLFLRTRQLLNSCLCENVYFMLSEMYDTQL